MRAGLSSHMQSIPYISPYEAPHSCWACDESFRTLNDLLEHFEQHPTSKCCHLCRVRFQRGSSLALHLENAHQDHSQVCPKPGCGVRSRNRWHMNQHLESCRVPHALIVKQVLAAKLSEPLKEMSMETILEEHSYYKHFSGNNVLADHKYINFENAIRFNNSNNGILRSDCRTIVTRSMKAGAPIEVDEEDGTSLEESTDEADEIDITIKTGVPDDAEEDEMLNENDDAEDLSSETDSRPSSRSSQHSLYVPEEGSSDSNVLSDSGSDSESDSSGPIYSTKIISSTGGTSTIPKPIVTMPQASFLPVFKGPQKCPHCGLGPYSDLKAHVSICCRRGPDVCGKCRKIYSGDIDYICVNCKKTLSGEWGCRTHVCPATSRKKVRSQVSSVEQVFGTAATPELLGTKPVPSTQHSSISLGQIISLLPPGMIYTQAPLASTAQTVSPPIQGQVGVKPLLVHSTGTHLVTFSRGQRDSKTTLNPVDVGSPTPEDNNGKIVSTQGSFKSNSSPSLEKQTPIISGSTSVANLPALCQTLPPPSDSAAVSCIAVTNPSPAIVNVSSVPKSQVAVHSSTSNATASQITLAGNLSPSNVLNFVIAPSSSQPTGVTAARQTPAVVQAPIVTPNVTALPGIQTQVQPPAPMIVYCGPAMGIQPPMSTLAPAASGISTITTVAPSAIGNIVSPASATPLPTAVPTLFRLPTPSGSSAYLIPVCGPMMGSPVTSATTPTTMGCPVMRQLIPVVAHGTIPGTGPGIRPGMFPVRMPFQMLPLSTVVTPSTQTSQQTLSQGSTAISSPVPNTVGIQAPLVTPVKPLPVPVSLPNVAPSPSASTALASNPTSSTPPQQPSLVAPSQCPTGPSPLAQSSPQVPKLQVLFMFVNQSREQALERRMNTRWNHKVVFSCRCCGAMARQPSLKVRHRYRHRREPYRVRCCCGRRFQARLHLLRHQLLHAEATCYICASCGKSFEGAQRLLRHKVMSKRAWKHVKSGHTFSRCLYKTLKICHKPFACTCGRTFARPSALLWHNLISSRHKIRSRKNTSS